MARNSKQQKFSKQNDRRDQRNCSSRKPGRSNNSRNRNPRDDDRSNKSQDAMNYAKDVAYSNDPAWYASDPTLARDSASIPFSWASGTTNGLSDNFIFANKPQLGKFVAPGICALHLRPTIGYADGASSPVNIAATAVYSFVRHANSGSANYDSPDLMTYILAMGEIVSYTNFLIRAYGVLSLYSSRNRYLPDTLLKSMGVDPDDLRENAAQFRYGLNLAMNKISSLAVPSTFSYLKRKAFVYSGVYTEGTSAKDQLYLMVPDSFYQLSYSYDDGKRSSFSLTSKLFYKPNNGVWKAADLIQFLNEMIDPMIMSEDINIMSGDILKAYGTDGILRFGRLDENFSVPIGFNILVLEQIKNATLPSNGGTSIVNATTIEQDSTKGYLVCNEVLTADFGGASPGITLRRASACLFTQNSILTTTTADVGPDLVLENTRLMATGRIIQGSQFTPLVVKIIAMTEIPTRTVIWAANTATQNESDMAAYSYTTNQVIQSDNPAFSDSIPILQRMALLASFKFAPRLDFYIIEESSISEGAFPEVQQAFRFVSCDNYAILTPEDLERMNEACLLNMLHVPAIGSVFS